MVTLTEIGIFRIADGKISGKLDYFSSAPPGSSRLHQTNDRQVRSLPTEKGAVNY